MVLRQPAWTAFVVAFTSRLILVIGSHVTHRWPLIPDEGQYVEMATLATDGRINDFCCGGYGPALYSSIRLFMWQLHGLVELFGPRPWILQMPAVLYGAAGAYVVSRIAGRFVSARWTLFVGLVMALLPSAMLHSSTVLRESLIWLLVAGVAWLVFAWTEDSGPGRLVISSAGLLLAVVGLGWLRDQTAVVVVYSLVPVSLLVRSQRRARIGLVLVLLVVGPWLTASGPAGLQLVNNAALNLGSIRTWMSMEAESSFVSSDVLDELVTSSSVGIEPSSSREESEPSSSREESEPSSSREESEPSSSREESGAVGIAKRQTESVIIEGKLLNIISGNLIVDNSMMASIRSVPNGLAAFYIRPLPWEITGENSLAFRLASVENILWLVGYGFALFGIRPLWRQHPAMLVFGASYLLLIGLVASVTQGNLGTAFRHRNQVLWVVVLLAALGGDRLWQSRQVRRVETGLTP
jgi:4-amino-4-deoxy-L-arabinose transferase-like glycosyltransferase